MTIAEIVSALKQKFGDAVLSTVEAHGEHTLCVTLAQVVYELYGYSHGKHLRIKSRVSEDASAPTVSDLWPTADWHEREVYDMMGIDFEGHPDLRRILMWEGYPFFPLRKDFPLEGRPSDMPDVAFTGVAPLEGGPFVTSAGGSDTITREPRARTVD